jgi:hypothetical protein
MGPQAETSSLWTAATASMDGKTGARSLFTWKAGREHPWSIVDDQRLSFIAHHQE